MTDILDALKAGTMAAVQTQQINESAPMTVGHILDVIDYACGEITRLTKGSVQLNARDWFSPERRPEEVHVYEGTDQRPAFILSVTTTGLSLGKLDPDDEQARAREVSGFLRIKLLDGDNREKIAGPYQDPADIANALARACGHKFVNKLQL